MPGGAEVTEEYTVEPETGRLYVITEVAPPMGGEKAKFRRIYDRR
jgi:hypothetical protein